MLHKIILPDLGAEPAEPIVVSFWFSDLGDEVFEGERLVELLIGSATFDLPAPVDGRLASVLAFEDETVQIGEVLGMIEAGESISDGEADDSEPLN